MGRRKDDQEEAAPEVSPASRPVEEGGDAYHSRILIKPGGEVVIENLSMDLMELVEMLDPDSPVVCQIPGLEDAPAAPVAPPAEPAVPSSEDDVAEDDAVEDEV